jgi:outer membrane protein
MRKADLSQDKAPRGRRRCNEGSINKQRALMSRVVRLLAATAAIAPAIASAQAPVDTGDWIVRVRGTYLQSANKDSTGLDLSINDKLLPELDITRFITPNLAAELVLTYPQKQTISAGGTPIGSLKHLPPVLTLQYHLTGLPVRPYAGVGVNWTHFSDVQFDAATTQALHPSVKSNSFGAALQAGIDVPLAGGWLINADAKWVQIRTDVRASGVKVGTFRVDPWLLSLGAGYRF